MAIRHWALATTLLALIACAQRPAGPPPLATVDTYAVSLDLFSVYTKKQAGFAPDKLPADRRASLLKDLTHLVAAAQRGESVPGIASNLELSRLEILAKAGATAAGVYARPTDSELRTEYQRFTRSLPANAFHVAHILVATEGQAGILSARLQTGEDFGNLAMKESADDSKSRGGDLGWIAPGHLPIAFTDTVKTLKVGTFTLKPVHTPYGWHLIKLLETRPSKSPPLEDLKPQLIANLQQARYQRFLDSAFANTPVK